MLNPQKHLSTLDWGMKWDTHLDQAEDTTDQPILPSEFTATSRLRVAWNGLILLMYCYILYVATLLYQRTEGKNNNELRKPLSLLLLSSMLNAECLELIFVHTYCSKLALFGTNGKWVISSICSLASIVLLQLLEPSLSLRAMIALLSVLNMSSVIAMTSVINRDFEMYSFIYLFIHTSLLCMLFGTFSQQTKIELFRWREYFLSLSLLCSLIIMIDQPLLKRKVKQVLPLIFFFFTNAGLMALGRFYSRTWPTERRYLVLNISVIIYCVFGLYQARVERVRFQVPERGGSSIVGSCGPVYEGLIISVLLCVSFMYVFNLSNKWRLLLPGEEMKSLSILIPNDQIREPYWLHKLHSLISSRHFMPAVIYSIFFLALLLSIFIIRSPLYYCPAEDSEQYPCTNEGILLANEESMKLYCHNIVFWDNFLLYLSAILASFNLPESVHLILYFILTLSGSVATLAVSSSEPQIHFGVCYQLAHIGMVHLLMSSQQNRDGLNYFKYKGDFIWLSLLSSLICFIHRTVEPFVRSLVVVPFIAACWEPLKVQSNSLCGTVDDLRPFQPAIWFIFVYLLQFLNDFSPKIFEFGIFSRDLIDFFDIINPIIFSAMNNLGSCLWFYLAI